MNYIYCAWDHRRWELLKNGQSITTLTPSALYHLLATGAVRGEQEIRKEGEATSGPASRQLEVLKRTAYGQIFPELFAQEDLFWYYRGVKESIWGPFNGRQMLSWFQGGYLYEKMKVTVQKDLMHHPLDEEFISLENLLWFLSQPIYCSESMSCERPMKELSHVQCQKQSFGACVGEWNEIRQLLSHHLPIMPMSFAVDEKDEPKMRKDEVMVSALQEIVREKLPAALSLFCKRKSFWYYLGQRSYSTIHGPYDGQRMFSWFQQGWLSLDLLIWNTAEELVSIDLKNFKSLKDHLAQQIL